MKTKEDLNKLIKNFALISLVEAAKNTAGRPSTSSSLLKSKTAVYNNQGHFSRDLEDLEENKSEGAYNDSDGDGGEGIGDMSYDGVSDPKKSNKKL